MQAGQCLIDAIRNRNILWPSGIVFYAFHSSIDSATQTIIEEAIREIENKTCLQFQLRASDDYIEFTGEGDGCSSSSVGKSEGKQLIRLPVTSSSTCRTHGIVLHQICHALGMWHEQSRPDRDQYIEILEENIEPDKLRNFNRRKTFQVDYHGQFYDYGSIMHYGEDYFSENGNDTLKVGNGAEYDCRGQPVIGQRLQLSESDVAELNQMYNCPGSGYGVPGILRVHIKNGIELSNGYNYPTAYVNVTAVDDSGKHSTYLTRSIGRNRSPTWNQWIDFGERISWQYFEISVWNDNRYSANHQLTDAQTFTVSPGYHRNL